MLYSIQSKGTRRYDGMVDIADLKSAGGDSVPVRVRLAAPKLSRISCRNPGFSSLINTHFAAAFACAPGARLNVSVMAETPVTAMFLDVTRILNMCPSTCAHHGWIIRNLLGELAEKNLRFSEKLTHMGQRSTRAKLMSYFSAEAQRLGKYEFDIPFSRQQLADYLGVERSGLSLELGKMRSEGLIDFHKSHFTLKV